tara:strand:+ start:2841 stop:3056 length:216 start_codon:yes stop_codon:yes gene_type:complete
VSYPHIPGHFGKKNGTDRPPPGTDINPLWGGRKIGKMACPHKGGLGYGFIERPSQVPGLPGLGLRISGVKR